MSHATLVITQPGEATREVQISEGSVSIGRALDNTISLEGDSNVSRYHAVIEARGPDFWLRDLGSSNGTTLNHAPVEYDRKLTDGDLINVGGTSTISFHSRAIPASYSDGSAAQTGSSSATDAAQGVSAGLSANAPSVSSVGSSVGSSTAAASGPVAQAGGLSPVILIAAIGGGLVLVTLVALILYSKFSGGCQASARILSPQSGATLRGPIPVRIEAEGTKCIDRVIYQLDGQKIASSEVAPYEIVLDPEKLEGLSSGNHILTVTVEDEDGNKNLQPETVLLAFDAGTKGPVVETPAVDAQVAQQDQQTAIAAPQTMSAFDIKDMIVRLARRVNPKNDYIFDRDFVQQVQTRTKDYESAGYFERARVFRDVINDSFFGEQGLEAPLGFVTAMSRSRFTLAREKATGGVVTGIVAGDEPQGLWLIQPTLAQTTGYIGRCGTTTLSDVDQKCSAIVASMYTKFLVVDIFAGDFLYAVACFGMQPKDAALFRDQLPPDRRDFWKVLKSPEQRDRVVRFFAAGIVGENPQKFGLSRDKPLSNLYPQK